VQNWRYNPAWFAWLALVLFHAQAPGASPPAVVVVASPGVEAHRLAIEGIHAGLAAASPEIRMVDLAQLRVGPAAGAQLVTSGSRVIIAVGSEALELVSAQRPGVPVISTMVLNRASTGDLSQTGVVATISLDVSVQDLAARLKLLFPAKTRIGVIYNQASGRSNAAQMQAAAQRMGYTLRVAYCAGPEQLLAALLSLRGQVDFVWCLPDGTLYNSATIRPLILASLENRIPLIGFSESFTRAGAALGVYPDFRDVGWQTGEAARRLLENKSPGAFEGPRRLKVALNQSVLRLLGLRYEAAAEASGELSIIQ
jgi:putative ABC transport system substrate-binding protein